MSIYSMTNVPINDPKHQIIFTVEEHGHIILWNAPTGSFKKEDCWRICDTYVGDHMFEPKNQQLLREMYARDIIAAIEKALLLGYARAQRDIRRSLGIEK